MTASDAILIGSAGLLCVMIVIALFKELMLLCFDEGFAGSRGYPVVILDLLIMGLVVTITMIGLQAVGLVLMIALLVIPAAAARFWTQSLQRMIVISSIIGGLGGMVGSAISAYVADVPSGPAIVLVCSSLFFLSMVFGTSRGVLVRSLRRRHLNQIIDRQHVLRGLFELLEPHTANDRIGSNRGVPFSQLLNSNSWSVFRLNRTLEQCRRERLIERNDDASLSLTSAGLAEASRLAHEHRLWELYLITHADVAPGRVDQSADAIEHVLEPELIARLEQLLRTNREQEGVIPSPHPIEQPGDSR